MSFPASTMTGRRRPRRGGQNGSNERLFWSLAVIIVVLVVSYWCDGGDDDAAKQNKDKVKSRSIRKRKGQCRTSCEDIILEAATPIQRGGSTSTKIDFHGDEHDEQHRATAAAAMRSVLKDDSSSTPVSSGALTTSALDALYHRRHEVSEGYDPSPQQSESPRPRTDVDTSSSSSSSSSSMSNSSRAVRPLYLPPLIETLVGAIDMDATQNDTKQDDDNGRSRQNLIRRPKDEKLSSRKSSLDSIIKGGDATTKAAAATAATFWSSLQSRGRALVGRPSRMKNVNEEWDAALRWIAGWGKDELKADSAAVSTDKAKKADAFKRRSRIQSRKASKLGQSATKWDLVERLTAEEASELLLLIEMCVDKCVEMTEDSEWNDKLNDRGSSTPSASNSAVTDKNGSRSGQTDVGSLPQSLFSLALPHPFAAGVLGLLLSSTLAYFLHMGYDWTVPWQQRKGPSSEWVSSKMEHDDRVAMPSNKSGGKKGKRRKRQAAKPSVSSPENEKKPASNEQEESLKIHTAQLSKSPSQNSLSDDDDANLVGLVRNTKRSSKSTSGNTPPRVPARAKIRGSTDNVSNKHLDAPQCEPARRQGTRQLKGTHRNSKLHQKKFPVPTEAQRQASYQQLREFQQVQLARLVQMKKDAKLAAERAASVRKKASIGVSYSSVASSSSSPTSPPRPAPETLAANLKGRNAKKDAKDAETETAFSSYATSPRSNIATPCQDLVQDHPLDDTAGELLLSSLSDVLDDVDDQYQKRSYGSAVSPPLGFLSNATAAPANTGDQIQSPVNVDGSSLDAHTVVRSTSSTWSGLAKSSITGSYSGIW